MAEYIDRRAANDAVTDAIWNGKRSMHDVASAINSVHNAYVAPVRHGRWVQVIVHVEFEDCFVDRVEEYCSVCHEPNERRCTYFCPNCGAKMDGGAIDGDVQ